MAARVKFSGGHFHVISPGLSYRGPGMDQGPQEPPPGVADGQPKLFKSIHGWIAGATGIIVALGGLAATWDRIFPPRPAAEQAVAAAPAETAPAAEAVDATEAEPEAGDPISYKGELVEGGKVVTINWDGESWVVTEGDGDPWSYDDTLSPDENRVMAVSNGNYLRWPIEGGEVDESEDKVKWKTYAKVDPVAEPAEE